jgi:hypothetical protein
MVVPPSKEKLTFQAATTGACEKPAEQKRTSKPITRSVLPIAFTLQMKIAVKADRSVEGLRNAIVRSWR